MQGMGIKKLDHLVLTTQDPEACAAFYQALGFRLHQGEGRMELFSGEFKINVHFLGRELEPKALRVQPGSADLCFQVEGTLSQWEAHLETQGIPVELGPVPRHGVQGEMTSLYLRDPDGNLVELCQYPSP